VLLSRRGEVLQEVRIDLQARRLRWTPLAEISPALKEAVMKAEDRRFLSHSGVDWKAAAGALAGWLSGEGLRGASTISMQTAALLDPRLRASGRRSWMQKWKQVLTARALERSWSKPQILEAYLNLVWFRGELQGVEAASRGLFGKRPHGLERDEAALLAALIRSPNAPWQRVAERARALQSETAPADGELEELTQQILSGGYRHIAHADSAFHAARQLLASAGEAKRSIEAGDGEARNGQAGDDEEGGDAGGGIKGEVGRFGGHDDHGQDSNARSPGQTRILSTLDAPLQGYAAQLLAQHLGHARGRNVRDGAVLVADNASGEVLVYLGGSGELSSARYVDGVQALRQAGSTLKPFLYGLAFERRLMTPASLLLDEPMEMSMGGGVYRPENYDRAFRGWVTARTALASSLNVPAVQTWQTVGGESFVERLRGFGLGPLLEADFYGPSLALGSAEVRLWDLVNAYRTLANSGRWTPLTLRPRREERGGEDASPGAVAARQVLSPEATFLVGRILSDRQSRASTFGLESALSTRFWSAVKTGTSKDMRDNWCVGFSRRYTVGVWVGNFSGEPMWDVSGVTGAAPVWVDLMNRLHEEVSSTPPPAPPGVAEAEVTIQGEGKRREWFIEGTQPRVVRPRPRTLTGVRILSPADGTLFALDPEIPPRLQRLFFRTEDCPECRWRLNGNDLGPVDGPYRWEPVAGRHLLQLTGPRDASSSSAAASVLDAVAFQVRGSLARTDSPPD
ncbi:MAG TPA: transglycosylase domain-containing protein, partial [Acidobacteriota bacterium]|nr:transglycosylase domain-containing protein [Acidobacteriota bacterium]